MLDIYICDDNPVAINLIKRTIKQEIEKKNIDMQIKLATTDPFALLENIEVNTKPNIYFLDIILNAKINGIELASQIREREPSAYIIFISGDAKQHELIFKYKIQALDYIIKYDLDDLEKRICECIDYVHEELVKSEKPIKNMFTISDKGIKKFVEIDKIILVEIADSHLKKLSLYTKTGRYVFNGSLKETENSLNASDVAEFVYINRSCLLNLAMIKALNNDDKTIILCNDIEVMCSRRYFSAVKKSFTAFKAKQE